MKYLLLMILLFPFAAQAKTQSDAVCKTLTKYKKVNNVTYQPGVDVNGNAVVPADANEPPMIIESVTRVPLTVNLAQRLFHLQGTGIEMDGDFGLLEIHPDGRVLYGDQDWTSDIKAVCGIVTDDAPARPIEIREATEADIIKEAEKSYPNKVQIEKEELKAEEPKVIEKIITHRPELVPETLQGGEYRE